MIYVHTTTASTASGSTSSTTLKVIGGLMRYLLVRANTDTTVFRTNLVNDSSVTELNYGFHTGELVDDKASHPVAGEVTINITNASPDDIFRIIFKVEE